MLDWTRYAIFWGVFPLGFTGAEDVLDDPHREPVHRLTGLIGWLDHLVELGCNGLLLNPLFASMSHGYDTLDYFRIDPRIGDEADFDVPGRGLPRARDPSRAGRRVQPRRPGVPGADARPWPRVRRRRPRTCSASTPRGSR